jgi:hypothetical protein
MSSPLLALILVAVLWLAFWSVKDHSRPSKTWWMFAMREPVASKSKERQGPYIPGQSAASRGKTVQQIWRRSNS